MGEASGTMLPTRIHRPTRQVATLSKQSTWTEESPASRTNVTQRTNLAVLESGNKGGGPAMPFLSPAIPARLPKDDRPIERLTLSNPTPEEYFGSFSSTSFHDSDSDDDDNFGTAKGRRNDLTSPHKVINVPLPRTCGAVFGRDGSLVVFHPPRSRPSIPSKNNAVSEEIQSARQDKQRSMITLFPTFGNLFSSVALLMPSVRSEEAQVDLVNVLGLDQASYSSQKSWRPQSTAAAPLIQSGALPMVRVSIQQLSRHLGVPDRELAVGYRVVTIETESGSALCLANAATAVTANRPQDALIWQMLAKLIEDGKDRTAMSWTDHPLGSCWLVRRTYALAETHGNIQMLANITAALIGSVGAGSLASLGRLADRMAISERAIEDTAIVSSHRASVPKLQTEPSTAKSSRRSPNKTNASSAVSSRGPSQPTTPRLESSSSTPPWSFLTQPSTKAALANSISPETSRGSFSAAVKSYAQSVSDKFAAYGTSPPVRRSTASTGNELSTSLHSTGGSWAKSVSFASTTLTQRTSALSRRTTDVEEDYDSDRTIDDAVIIDDGPYDSARGPQFVWKNQDAFSTVDHGTAKTSLIPKDILLKCSIWVTAYVELLRSWDLTRQAVEMAKIGMTLQELQGNAATQTAGGGAAASTSAQPVVCSICTCLIEGLNQICSGCQHSSHMECLALFDSGDFECPQDCGCNCVLNAPD